MFLGLDQYGSGSESDNDVGEAGERIEQQASGSEDSTEINRHDKQRRYSEEKAERNNHQASREMVDKNRLEKKVLKSWETRQSPNEKCVKISETVGKVNHGKPSIHSKSTSLLFIILQFPL